MEEKKISQEDLLTLNFVKLNHLKKVAEAELASKEVQLAEMQVQNYLLNLKIKYRMFDNESIANDGSIKVKETIVKE